MRTWENHGDFSAFQRDHWILCIVFFFCVSLILASLTLLFEVNEITDFIEYTSRNREWKVSKESTIFGHHRKFWKPTKAPYQQTNSSRARTTIRQLGSRCEAGQLLPEAGVAFDSFSDSESNELEYKAHTSVLSTLGSACSFNRIET